MINLKTLPPIVQGAAYARLVQGVNVDGTIPTAANPAPFLASDTLTATISAGQNLPALFAPTAAWYDASLARFSLSIAGAQSATLAIDTPYLVEVFATRSGVTYPLMAGYLPVLPAAGTQAAATPPDLVTLPYAAQLLQQMSLTEPQLEAVPSLITAASAAIRKYCVRTFTQQTYTEVVPVELDGTVRLREIPVNAIQRIQSTPQVALTLGNPAATSAWVNQSSAGDQYTGVNVTGLVLNWQQAGGTYSATFPFASGMMISDLAGQINGTWAGVAVTGTPPGAPPYGWSATADAALGAWPVSELAADLLTAQGAGAGDEPDSAAEFRVFSENVNNAYPHPDDGARTGIWYVGRQYGGGSPARWGPDWAAWDIANGPTAATVKVTYSGGFVAVPYPVQLATVELVKHQLNRLKTDLLLASETASEYSYSISDAEVLALPKHVLQGLAEYRVIYA